LPALLVLMVRVEVPEPPEVKEMLVGFSPALIPVEGVIVSLSATVPMNPFTLVRLIVVEPEAPTGILTLAGFAAIAKSVTLTLTIVECTIDPAVAVMVIV